MNRLRPPLLILLGFGGMLLLLYFLRQALIPFFTAMVLAYLLAPLVRQLGRHMRRGIAVTLVLIATLSVFALVVLTLVPWLWEQGERFVRAWPGIQQSLELRYGPWFDAHPELKRRVLSAMHGTNTADILKGLATAGIGAFGLFLNALALLLVPVILYYLLLEGEAFLHKASSLVPPRYLPKVQRYARTVHDRLGGYIRGQLAVATVMAVLQGAAFALMGVPYAWLLGMLAGISNFVPYSPYITALVPGLLLASHAGRTWPGLLLIASLFAAVQKVETLYLTPVWIGRAARLHPLEVLLAVLCFGFLFGLLGLVFAVPLMILVKVAVEQLVVDYQTHAWFLKTDDPRLDMEN